MRFQIPAYTDAWMKGDRYGELVKVSKSRKRALKSGQGPVTIEREIAHIKLDISGKIVRVILDDCTIV